MRFSDLQHAFLRPVFASIVRQDVHGYRRAGWQAGGAQWTLWLGLVLAGLVTCSCCAVVGWRRRTKAAFFAKDAQLRHEVMLRTYESAMTNSNNGTSQEMFDESELELQWSQVRWLPSQKPLQYPVCRRRVLFASVRELQNVAWFVKLGTLEYSMLHAL